MANLTPSASFDAVPQLETSTFALAGPGAPMNLQAQALLNRTQYLYVQLSNLAPVAISGDYNSLLNRPTLGSAAYQPSSTFATAAQGAKADGAAQASALSSVAFSGIYGELKDKPFASDAPQDSNIWGRKSGSWVIVGGDNATLMSDLASASPGKGADLVTFIQNGTGAIARTIQEKSRENVSIYDYIGIADAATDIAPAIADALANNVSKLHLPAGNYKLSSTAEIGGMEIYGDGPGTIIDATNGTFTSGYVLTANGSLSALPSLSADVTEGARSITFSSSPSLAKGDIFCIYDAADSSFSGFRTYYRAGEWCEVASISGNTVNLKNGLYDNYAASDVQMFKLSGPTPNIHDLTIQAFASYGVVKASLCSNLKFSNIVATHAGDSILSLDRCVGAEIHGLSLNNAGGQGNQYGVVIGNSQHIKVMGGNIYSYRHAVTTGGADISCGVPCRDILIDGATLRNDINSGVESGNFHGNSEDCRFVGCTSYSGFTLGGKDNSAIDCIAGHNLQGSCYVISEVKGGRFDIRGGKLRTFINPQSSTRGIIDVGGNSTTAFNASTVIPFTLSVHNIEMYGRNLAGTTSLAVIANRGANVKCNVEISDIQFDVNALGNVLFMECLSGTPISDYIVVDGICGAPSGVLLANLNNPSGGAYLNQPLRMQRQSGVVSGTTTSSTSYIAPTTSLKYTYPRVPNATCAVRGAGGAAQSLLAGQLGVAGHYQISNASVRPMVLASAAFTAGANFELSWETFLDEC